MIKLSNLSFLLIILSFFIISCENKASFKKDESTTQKDSTVANASSSTTTDDFNDQESNQDCLKKSKFKLPYSGLLDYKTIQYDKLTCNTISGVENFLCDETTLRYLSLPKFKNIEVIVVPMDCGDFNYRYFLLTVLNSKVVDSKYVEGEWYEPGDDAYKEMSTFEISSDYTITITTTVLENNVIESSTKMKYKISADGKFQEV